MTREVPWVKLVAMALIVAVVAAIVLIVRGGARVPDDLQPIAWNHQACAHCQMLVGDPHHAAQLITTEGDVLVFDDPGCALRYLDERAPRVHRMWFHHGTDDHWIPFDRTGFLTGGRTPMGSGLVAVERTTANALDVAAATRAAEENR